MKIKFITWDPKEKLDLDELNRALSDVHQYRALPQVCEIHAQGGAGVVAVTCAHAHPAEVQKFFDGLAVQNSDKLFSEIHDIPAF